MVLERGDLVHLCCGVILGFSLGTLATSGLLPTTGPGWASPSVLDGTSPNDWWGLWWQDAAFVWTPLMPAVMWQVAAVLTGWLWSILWALIVHVGSCLPSFEGVFPWALVAVVSCSPDGTFVGGAFEVPFLLLLALQGLAFVWAFKKVLDVADEVDSRRGRKSQRPRGKLRRLAKQSMARKGKSRTIKKDLGALSNELAKSPAHPPTITAAEQEATKEALSEVESTGCRVEDDDGQQRAESPAAGSLQGSQSAGVETRAPSVQDLDDSEDCRRELDKTLAMVDAAMAAKQAETQLRHQTEMDEKEAEWVGLLEAKEAELQALHRASEAVFKQGQYDVNDYRRELKQTLARVDAATVAANAETQEEHEAEIANMDAVWTALLEAMEAEVQALRKDNEAASEATHELEKVAFRELETTLEMASAEMAAREAKSQDKHRAEIARKDAERAAVLEAKEAQLQALHRTNAATAATTAKMQEEHEAEIANKDAIWSALVAAMEAEMQALRDDNEAASAAIHELDKVAFRELETTVEMMGAEIAVREAKTQDKHRADIARLDAESAALLEAKDVDLQALRRTNAAASAALRDASEREVGAAREGLEVAEAELSETRALLKQERAESARTMAVVEEKMDAESAELVQAKSETEAMREVCDRQADRISDQMALIAGQDNECAALKKMLEEANQAIDGAKDRVARQDGTIEDMKAGDAQKEAEIARLEAEVARLLDLSIRPGVKEEACAITSPSGSSATSLVSPCSSASPASGGSLFSTSSFSDGSHKREDGRKTKGEKKQASKLAAKRTRMPAGAPAVKSAQG